MYIKRGLRTWHCARGRHIECIHSGATVKVGDGQMIEHVPCRCGCHKEVKASEELQEGGEKW